MVDRIKFGPVRAEMAMAAYAPQNLSDHLMTAGRAKPGVAIV